jgi:hypothetical protein
MSVSVEPARRPGWITFAAVMLFIGAGLHALWAINEFADAVWVADVTNGILDDQLWLWALWDSAITLLFVYAGWDLLRGTGIVGRWVAVIAASVSIVRWMYWMPFAPLAGFTIVILASLVIYGVVVNWHTFERRA